MEATASAWVREASTFDDEADHGLRDPDVCQAWRALLDAHLPPAPSRVVDVGCGHRVPVHVVAHRPHSYEVMRFGGPRLASASIVVLACGACWHQDRGVDPGDVRGAIEDTMGFEDVAETDDAGLGFLAGVLDEAEAPFVVGQVSSGDVGSSCDSAWVAAFTANDTVRVSDLGDLINLGASATGKEPGDFAAIPNGPDAWLIEGDMESCAESVLAIQIDGTFVLASGSPAVVDMLFEICNEL